MKLILVLLPLLIGSLQIKAEALSQHERLALEIFKELIETDTTHSSGDTGVAAQKMADRLLAAGFPKTDVKVIINAPRKGNLVARLRSPNPVREPILLLAHLDVVEANPEDWSHDPFTFRELDEHYYGRGTLDDKDEAAIHIANLIWLKTHDYAPDRDIIVALTADEEGGTENGVQFLLAEYPELVDAAFVINEGGGGAILIGKHATNNVQTAEKVYQSFTLEVTNPGGHSSRPREDNAIYELAHALIRIQAHQFPFALNETTTAMFAASQASMPEEVARRIPGLLQTPPDQESISYLEKDYGALFRTTCVATQLEAGHAENALPQRARATVNCRVLPGVPIAEIRATLVGVIADKRVSLTLVQEATPSEPSPLKDNVMSPIRLISESMWPGVAVVPSMSTGATDGLFFRNRGTPVY
ncbi:MAG TPA: M20/M25/M40 family metallo-hydrolase, partial [Gammaproteobacteria bacterium]|nr:M20/M25/M40 family metallo-hydrolase [Gammaproteobacteria bacterium]